MKTSSITQEILLMTGSTFSKKRFCELTPPEGNRHMTPEEQLVEACWNGMVTEMLPEIVQTLNAGEKVFLWQVETGKTFLKMNFGTSIPTIEKEYSIDSRIFMSTREMN